MTQDLNRVKARVLDAANQALEQLDFVNLIEVFLHMGRLQPIHVKEWQKSLIPYLLNMIQVNPEKLAFAMKSFQDWALEMGLQQQEISYTTETATGQKVLRFLSDDETIFERAFRIQYLSKTLTETKQKKILGKLEKAPELVVFLTVTDSVCSGCNKRMPKCSFLFKEGDRALCLQCAKLDTLEFLPRGDAALTRRAKKCSKKHCVVVQFSRSRQRYERQGLLLERQAINEAKKYLGMAL